MYRLWRDLGYVAGALLTGLLADQLGFPVAIGAVAFLTAASAVVSLVLFRSSESGIRGLATARARCRPVGR